MCESRTGYEAPQKCGPLSPWVVKTNPENAARGLIHLCWSHVCCCLGVRGGGDWQSKLVYHDERNHVVVSNRGWHSKCSQIILRLMGQIPAVGQSALLTQWATCKFQRPQVGPNFLGSLNFSETQFALVSACLRGASPSVCPLVSAKRLAAMLAGIMILTSLAIDCSQIPVQHLACRSG